MWSIIQDVPETQTLPAGGDGIAHVWRVGREDGEQRSVRVEISESALASEELPDPLPEVIASKGATAVLSLAHWVEPPEVITVTTTNITPFPGSPDPAGA